MGNGHRANLIHNCTLNRIKNVEAYKACNSNNFYIVILHRNAHVTFMEKPKLKIISF